MQDFKQVLTEEMYSRQEELTFWDCDRDMRVRVAAILSKIGAFGGYHYDALGFPREMLIEKGFVFLSPAPRCTSTVSPAHRRF